MKIIKKIFKNINMNDFTRYGLFSVLLLVTMIVLRNLKCFEIINYIIAGLLSMTSCFTARNSINFIEEKYCYKNHAYMFRNVIFDMISAIGFIIMSVGLNKLIVTMKNHYARALRGKKEFNTDIINDD